MPQRRQLADWTDAQRAVLAPLVPGPRPGGRPAHHDRRALVDALLSVRRGGISWRAIAPVLRALTGISLLSAVASTRG
ncbi:MAG: transposase [Gemmatimonadota bacterium]|nr:transposase [Gemmatimonadota bacterium]